MSTRRTLPTVIAFSVALFFLGLGNYLGARQSADTDARFAAVRAELAQLRLRPPIGTTGATLNHTPTDTDAGRASIVDDVKRQLQDEMGLLPLNLLRARRTASSSSTRMTTGAPAATARPVTSGRATSSPSSTASWRLGRMGWRIRAR